MLGDEETDATTEFYFAGDFLMPTALTTFVRVKLCLGHPLRFCLALVLRLGGWSHRSACGSENLLACQIGLFLNGRGFNVFFAFWAFAINDSSVQKCLISRFLLKEFMLPCFEDWMNLWTLASRLPWQ